MSTLKKMFEVYRPKSPDEQKFVDKHVTIKHPDRNEVNGKANGDDVFKATNIKTDSRKETRHGYDVGDDEKVYEENEFFVEEDMLDEGIIDKLFDKPKKEMRTYTYSYGKTTDYPEGEKPFQKKTNPKAKNDPVPRDENGKTLFQRMTKENIISRTIEKYMPEVADIKPLTMEQRLAKKLDGLSENHTALLFSLFENLNEENQMKMIDTCEDMDGVNQLIDFALENNRGE